MMQVGRIGAGKERERDLRSGGGGSAVSLMPDLSNTFLQQTSIKIWIKKSFKPECNEYIQIFEYSNIFDSNIYSDIHSYHFLDTNIFGYSFVSTFWIRIYSDIRS